MAALALASEADSLGSGCPRAEVVAKYHHALRLMRCGTTPPTAAATAAATTAATTATCALSSSALVPAGRAALPAT